MFKMILENAHLATEEELKTAAFTLMDIAIGKHNNVEAHEEAVAEKKAKVETPTVRTTNAEIKGTPASNVERGAMSENYKVALEDVDSKGVKYDPSIHARTRAKNADGTWRLKRNLRNATDTTDAEDETEETIDPKEIFKAKLAEAAHVATPVIVKPESVPAANVPPPPAPVEVTQATPAPAANPAYSFETKFRELLQKITKKVTTGELTHVELNSILNPLGFKTVLELQPLADMQLVDSVSQAIDDIKIDKSKK